MIYIKVTKAVTTTEPMKPLHNQYCLVVITVLVIASIWKNEQLLMNAKSDTHESCPTY